MKKIWDLINGFNIKKNLKNSIYIETRILIHALIGFLVWLIAGRFFLSSIEWMLCFIGYPAVFSGFFGGILYIYNHEFA